MRGFIVPALVAVTLAASPFAFAAETATGAIKSFDMKAHTLTLENGTTYMLPAGFKDPGFKKGEKVSVVWEMKDGKHEASAVTIVK
jgi:Cu/Ag efflux protein CusF